MTSLSSSSSSSSSSPSSTVVGVGSTRSPLRDAAATAARRFSAQIQAEAKANRRDKIDALEGARDGASSSGNEDNRGGGGDDDDDDDGYESDEEEAERRDDDWKRRNKHKFAVDKEESARHPRFGEVIWVNYTSDRWWPGFAFRPTIHLRRDVLELFAKRKVGDQFLVCYCGRGDFSLCTTPQIESFNPDDHEKVAKVKHIKGFNPAYAFAAEQCKLPIEQRRLGCWSPLTGLPDVWLTRKVRSNKNKKARRSRDGDDDDDPDRTRRGSATRSSTTTCVNCGLDFTSSSSSHPDMVVDMCAACVKRAPCDVCGSEADEENFLLCSQAGCIAACHLYCTPFPLSEHDIAHIDVVDWYCPVHECLRRCEALRKNATSDDEVAVVGDSTNEVLAATDTPALNKALRKVYGMKVVPRRDHPEGSTFLYLQMGKWKSKGEVSSEEGHDPLAEFMREDNHYFRLSTNLCYRGGLAVHPRTTPDGSVTTWFFANGTPFGITQHHALFDDDAVAEIEAEVAAVAGDVERLERLKRPTVDASLTKKRLKIFLGYRYHYGAGVATEAGAKLFNDVDGTEALGPALARASVKISDLVKLNINQVVVNIYLEKGSSLGVHKDSKKLFRRPISSLRLFSDCVLSFGCTGLGNSTTEHFVGIPLKRGTVTVMSGIAAENFNHCVRARDVTACTASILFREVNLEEVAENDEEQRSPVVVDEASSSTTTTIPLEGDDGMSDSPRLWIAGEDVKDCVEMFNNRSS